MGRGGWRPVGHILEHILARDDAARPSAVAAPSLRRARERLDRPIPLPVWVSQVSGRYEAGANRRQSKLLTLSGVPLAR